MFVVNRADQGQHRGSTCAHTITLYKGALFRKEFIKPSGLGRQILFTLKNIPHKGICVDGRFALPNYHSYGNRCQLAAKRSVSLRW